MSLRWFQKLAESAPVGGHWRRLSAGQKGQDQFGNETTDRTWVKVKAPLAGKTLPAPATPGVSAATAYPHQADFQKAFPDRGGIIAAHGTGTGKTFSAISAFEEKRREGKATRALVITPAGLRGNFIHKGVERFTESKSVMLTRPEAPDPSVSYAVVSYEAFRQNPQAYMDAVKPDTLIVDEAHRLSNMQSKNYKSVMSARLGVDRVMLLTASIAQNKPSDVVPLLNVASGVEHTRAGFNRRFTKQVGTGQHGIFGGSVKRTTVVGRDRLAQAVGPYIHYVEDLDASQKPTKNVTTVPVQMSKKQLALYSMSMKGVDPVVRAKIERGEPVSQGEAMGIFTRLLRARQVSNSLNSVTNMTPTESAEATPKIKRVLDDAVSHIDSTPDSQVVMYTNLVHGGVDVLKAGLDARGIKYGVFAGRGVEGMTEANRQQTVDDYLAGKIKVIVITGAGAEGLSLGNTTMVQMVDGHYNPERILQAEARGVRAGGLSHRAPEQRKVEVKRYVSSMPQGFFSRLIGSKPKRSVDEWVYATAARKAGANRELRDVLKERSEQEQKKRESPSIGLFGG